MKCQYHPVGVCPSIIEFEIVDGKVYNIHFQGGCPGNTKMVAKLLDGMEVEKVIECCKGNLCGMRGTSCADQLAVALEKQISLEKVPN